MYQFLDRKVWQLDEHHRFLLAAMRLWVESARGGRCACTALADGFAARGVGAAIRDFGMATVSLDRDGIDTLRFAPRGAEAAGEDEARLLALFDAGLAGDAPRLRRIAATLVTDEAVARLATAVEWVALHLTNGVIEERDV